MLSELLKFSWALCDCSDVGAASLAKLRLCLTRNFSTQAFEGANSFDGRSSSAFAYTMRAVMATPRF